ncbi:MAG: hypothetical protein GY822_25645 [Deltaproteobacteria bacterium]|nr:hypothetical protein [Deltaproteobacteria bacterium]
MRNFSRSSVLFVVVILSLPFLGIQTAAAHIDLQSPVARYSLAENSAANKACPCGVGEPGNNRNCDVEGDRSDPDRSDRVTVLEAGSSLTLRFDEYVGHGGRYRVAFDDDGADLEDFNDHILLDIPDPSGDNGNIGEGSMWEITVTVPDVPCDNCTLQLIQMMNGNTADPVLDPIGLSSYYQCADIVITGGSDPRDAGAAEPDPSEVDAGSGGGDDVGCRCMTSSKSDWSFLAWSVLFFGWLGRRRRQ